MMYLISLKKFQEEPRKWILCSHFDPESHTKHAEREITADDMLDWIDQDWPEIIAGADYYEIKRLEPGQGAHNMFLGKNIREALRKAMITPPFQGPFPLQWEQMSDEEKYAANNVENIRV